MPRTDAVPDAPPMKDVRGLFPDLHKVKLEGTPRRIVEICGTCLRRVGRSRTKSVVQSASVALVFGLTVVFVWWMARMAAQPTLERVAANLVGAAAADESREVLSAETGVAMLGVVAAVAIAITVATGEMANRVAAIDERIRGSKKAVALADIKALSTVRLLCVTLFFLTGCSLGGAIVVLVTIATDTEERRPVTLVLGLLLAAYLLVHLTASLETWRGRDWLEPRISQVRSIDVARRIRGLKSAGGAALNHRWSIWWGTAMLPWLGAGLAPPGAFSIALPFVGLLVTVLTVVVVRQMGAVALLEQGWSRGFTYLSVASGVATLGAVELLFTNGVLRGLETDPVPTAVVLVGTGLALVVSAWFLQRGYVGLGWMRVVVHREVEYVKSNIAPAETIDGPSAALVPDLPDDPTGDGTARPSERRKPRPLRSSWFWATMLLAAGLQGLALARHDWQLSLAGMVLGAAALLTGLLGHRLADKVRSSSMRRRQVSPGVVRLVDDSRPRDLGEGASQKSSRQHPCTTPRCAGPTVSL